MKKKVLFLSGGGTKIVFLASAAIHLIRNKGIRFNHIVGVSAGSLLSLLLAMNEFDVIKNLVLESKDSDIFEHSPQSIIGRLIALWNIVTGNTYLYNDSALRRRLKSVITKDKFNRYKSDNSKPKCYAVCVDINNGEELLIDIKNQEYENALEYILASSAIPVFVPKKIVNGRNLYDGGLRSHIGASTWLKKHVKQINECYSIYSRPERLENITWNGPTISIGKKRMMIFGLIYGFILGPITSIIALSFGYGNQFLLMYINLTISAIICVSSVQINIISILKRSIEILNLEVSKSDEREADDICFKYLKRNEKVFAPYKLLDGPYDNSLKDNLRMWNLGIQEVENNPELWRVR